MGLGLLFPEPAGRFPWTTLAINVSGSFLLGAVLLERFGPSRLPRPFIATGFIGAFTTFSTLTVDTTVLMKDGHQLTAAYLVATVAGGLVAAWSGMAAGSLVQHPIHDQSQGREAPLREQPTPAHMTFIAWVAVVVAGALGAPARYLIDGYV